MTLIVRTHSWGKGGDDGDTKEGRLCALSTNCIPQESQKVFTANFTGRENRRETTDSRDVPPECTGEHG